MLRLVLAISYPLLAHASVLTGSRTLSCTALAVLAIVVLYPGLRRWNRHAWTGLAAFVAVAAALAVAGDSFWLMVTLSIALPALVAGAFVQSLRSGKTPIITLIAARMNNPLSTELATYTRRLTALWAGVIALLLLIELALAVFATPQAWSSYANGYVYAVLAAVFVVEYLYRRIRYRRLQQPKLHSYLKQLLRSRDLTTGRFDAP